MVGLPSCHLAILPHRCSHDYKLLIQKGESKASERPRATDGEATGTLRRIAARVSMLAAATTNRMTALFNLRTSKSC